MIGEIGIMEKIWFAEYQKTGIPETVELPAENTSLVDIFERSMSWKKLVVNSQHIYKVWVWQKAHVLP